MIKEIYKEIFGEEAETEVKSPGRINVIGEHTDYNNGYVLPAAIDRYGHVAAGKRNDTLISLYAKEYNERFEVQLTEIKSIDHNWTNYVLGVVDQLVKKGYPVSGFNLTLTGDVPVGAGLSSSAAIECAVCAALNELFSLKLTKFEIVKISQLAEQTFAKVNVGVMDMFASVFGKKDHALKLDCRSLEYEEVPLQLEGYKIVLLNSNVKHALASTEYNTRRKECEAGTAEVRKHLPEVLSLRDMTVEMAENFITDPVVKKRCRFVIEENERVLKAVEHMKSGNIQGLGEQMLRSHDGLSKEYEVSCKELDWLVTAVRHNPLVAGARMMGGGFGGCTINIIREGAITELVEYLAANYETEMGKKLTVYMAKTADGTHVVNSER
jgi:galactokinase